MPRILVFAVWAVVAVGCAVREPDVVLVDPAKIEAPLAERRRWVSEQKKRDRARFEAEYDWMASSRTIGSNEARQIAHLFFYSAGSNCGAFEEPTLANGVWRLGFLSGFAAAPGLPVFVDAKTGEVWQIASAKLDALALIRYE